MARNPNHSRKFHFEIMHYLKHKEMFKTTKLCWDNNRKCYVISLFFTQHKTFDALNWEVLHG